MHAEQPVGWPVKAASTPTAARGTPPSRKPLEVKADQKAEGLCAKNLDRDCSIQWLSSGMQRRHPDLIAKSCAEPEVQGSECAEQGNKVCVRGVTDRQQTDPNGGAGDFTWQG
jgi:hypothetical protein